MPYEAEINRANPSCFVFLIDQSYSMRDRSREGKVKKDEVANALNQLLNSLVLRCSAERGVLNYFKVAVIGYGMEDEPKSVLGGDLAGLELVTTSELSANPLRIDRRMVKWKDKHGRMGERPSEFPVWVEPAAGNRTPMAAAMEKAHALLDRWVSENHGSFPPIVLNLTDGMYTDSDPREPAERIRALKTSDGAALLFNLHISGESRRITDGFESAPVEFPSSADGLDEYAQILFGMSSELPDRMQLYAAEHGVRCEPGARGFVYNAGIDLVVRFLEIGTRAVPGGLGRL